MFAQNIDLKHDIVSNLLIESENGFWQKTVDL